MNLMMMMMMEFAAKYSLYMYYYKIKVMVYNLLSPLFAVFDFYNKSICVHPSIHSVCETLQTFFPTL